MKRIFFRRFSALIVAVLMLLPVLAVPIGAADTALGEQKNGFAVYQFENLKTTGENLSNQIIQLRDSGPGSYPYICSIDLKPDTWYYLKYSGAAAPTHTPVYLLYHGSDLTFSPDTATHSEFILYTGQQSGSCRLEFYSPDNLADSIKNHVIYQVTSFDTVYDVRFTSFAQDRENLFPDIDLSKYTGTSNDFIDLITVYEDITIADDLTWDGHVYLYLFNPSGKMITGGSLTAPDEDGNSTSFELEPVITMMDVEAEDWRFMKLEVTGHWWHHYAENEDSSLNIHMRRRNIIDLTLNYSDGTVKTFPYNGYFIIEDKQTDGEVISKTVTGDFDTKVTLDINYTYYRTDTSPQGAYYHNQVDSIYFNVPKYLEEDYGKLVDVKLSYQRVRTEPIFVTDNARLYTLLNNNILKDASTYNSSLPSLYWIAQFQGNTMRFGASYNTDLSDSGTINFLSDRVISPLRFVFMVDDVHAGIREAGSSVSRTEIEDWLYQYTEKMYPPTFVGPKPVLQGAKGEVAQSFFSEVDDVTVVNVASLNLSADSYKTNHSFFDQFCNYGLSYAINGISTDVDLDLSQAIIQIEKPYQLIGKSDVLYFAESDEENLRTCLSNATANDQSMYLVRFNVSQYYERPLATKMDGNTYGVGDDSIAYMAEEDIYLNLHVLELTYQNESGGLTRVPVESNHIDCIADLTVEKTPLDINKQANKELWSDILEKFKDFGKILALILGVVVAVLLVVFVGPIVAPVFKAIFGAIGSFFRWIADKIKGLFAKRKQRKSGKKR